MKQHEGPIISIIRFDVPVFVHTPSPALLPLASSCSLNDVRYVHTGFIMVKGRRKDGSVKG